MTQLQTIAAETLDLSFDLDLDVASFLPEGADGWSEPSARPGTPYSGPWRTLRSGTSHSRRSSSRSTASP